MEGDEGERVCYLRWLPIFPQLHIFGRNFTGVHLWKCSLWLYLVWITKLLRELSKETLTHFCQWAFKQKIRQNNINVYEKAKKGWDLSFHSIRKIYINSIPEKAVCICTIQLTVVNCDKKRLPFNIIFLKMHHIVVILSKKNYESCLIPNNPDSNYA